MSSGKRVCPHKVVKCHCSKLPHPSCLFAIVTSVGLQIFHKVEAWGTEPAFDYNDHVSMWRNRPMIGTVMSPTMRWVNKRFHGSRLIANREFPKGPVYFNEAACSWNGPGVCRWDYMCVGVCACVRCGVFEINRSMRRGGGRTERDGF